MSLNLGKIHYWLYDKILWFESLESEIINKAMEDKLPVQEWLKYMDVNFGEPTGGEALEAIIDTSNIHGWLQERIAVVEARQSYLITKILENNADYKTKIKDIFIAQGKQTALEYNEEYLTAEDVYNTINDYILEGMPCDRVNEVLESSGDKIIWKRTTCLHEKYWKSVGGDIAVFYELRDAWIKSFVNNLRGKFKYEKVSQDTQMICG
ncbi:hypothetical protein GC105_13620 [Alkalibaculum sp. M08DMB]|uniref:Uncharacterized protein n=1 Tax=Alkalibaculum sporogenes TaxID=2655001 RepID=A0A6A7KC07_9FIRM|nr:hypothetical protein [Alkalibaculum sporogenes]MPW26821.1 hypothetical protein [Alkalibaculum sporogenes]